MSKHAHLEFKHDIMTYMVEIARGNVPGADLFNAFGELVSTGAVTNHLIWPVEGTPNLTPVHATGVQISAVSSSTSDSAAGTGIRTLDIHYLDGDLDEQVEVITLNGTTPVLTVATDIRFIQCIHMVTYGSGRVAAGNIALSSGGVTYSYIKTGARRCSSSARCVPRGKRAFIHAMWGGSSSGTAAASTTVRLVTTALTGQQFSAAGITFPHASVSVQDGSEAISVLQVFPAEEGTVIAMEVTCDKGATINGGWAGWYENA